MTFLVNPFPAKSPTPILAHAPTLPMIYYPMVSVHAYGCPLVRLDDRYTPIILVHPTYIERHNLLS